jgi:hypothetical protein
MIVPKNLAPKDNPSTNAIFVPVEEFRIPLHMSSTMSVFDTRMPTREEIDSCRWITLKRDELWDPKSEIFNDNKEKVEYLYQNGTNGNNCYIMLLTRELTNIRNSFDDYFLLNHSLQGISTAGPRLSLTWDKLSQRCGIGLTAIG